MVYSVQLRRNGILRGVCEGRFGSNVVAGNRWLIRVRSK